MDAELNSAADVGNQAKLKELLAQIRPAEQQQEWLRKTLLRATYENRHKTVTTLLSTKANPTWTDERNEAALHWASRRGHELIARYLLQFKAQPNQPTHDGTTPLHVAAEHNLGSFCKLLTSARADANLTTREKRCPLHVAADHGCNQAAAVLLEFDKLDDDPWVPKLDLMSDRGETPLARAAGKGHGTLVTLLLRKNASIESKNWWGQGPLHLAAYNGHDSVVALLIKEQAEVDTSAQDGTTPLHSACERGHEKVAEYLLTHKGNVERCASGGRTAVHCAAMKGKAEVIRALLTHKVTLEVRNEEGRTPLSCAAARGNTAAVRLLCEGHADPQALDTVRQTPLHAAAASGQADTVEVLLDYRTRIDALDAATRTPIMLAHQAQQEAVVRLLLKRGASLPEGFGDAATMGAVVKEVEHERLQEMVRASEEGQGASLVKIAEREFEDARQRLLELAQRNAGAYIAPAVNHLETELAAQIAAARNTLEAEAAVRAEVAKYRDALADAEKLKLQGEKDAAWCLRQAELAKKAMREKIQKLADFKKQILEVQGLAKKSKMLGDALDQPLAEAREKVESLRAQIAELEAEIAALREKLAKVAEELEEWHERKRAVAELHQKAQELLNRETTTPQSSRRPSLGAA